MRCVASAAAVFLALAVCAGTAFGRVPVSFLFCYDPEKPETPATRRINTLASEDGTIDPVKWGSLILPGGGGRAAFTLALAGGSAPDIYKAWFHILRHDVAQGFVYPLDEWIDPAGVEKKDIWDEVSVFDSHVWALPTPGTKYYGILYRKDIVRAAGLDPEKPPRTWSEFRGWCRRLTCKGRRAFAVENRPWGFLPWINSARGDVVRRGRSGAFEASFDSPEAVAAARFLQSLVRDGTVRALPTLSVADDVGRLFISGEIVAVFGGEDLVSRLTETLAFPSEEIGLMPFPARDEGGVRVLQAHRHFYAMSDSVRFRPKEERDLVFKCLEALASPALADEDVKRNVAEGRAMWCLPSDLERLGFSRELEAMPPATREMYEDLAKGEISAVTEPWVGFWQGASDLMQRHFLGVLLSDAGPGMDVAAALSKINEEANSGLMFDAGRSGLEKARPFARIILCAFVFSAAAAAFLIRRAAKARSGSSGGGRRTAAAQSKHSFVPWLFLAPALVSILLWSYYPLVKGALMAFQDYRIVGRSEWVGLDNFLRVAMSPAFWTA
ncbi:MAG: extracellular solute-binding protein, partial [Kiritimatiellae bacterium]|nr:extracellular solute-binding protein [Kiritimatiellia bacterium]